jgi:hypothetical protein
MLETFSSVVRRSTKGAWQAHGRWPRTSPAAWGVGPSWALGRVPLQAR